MDFSIVGDMGALLGYQELAVGMTFLLTGMIAQDKDIHDSGSRTGKKPRSTQHMLSQPHPGVVLEINAVERWIKVALIRTFSKEKSLQFMLAEERRYWAPVVPAPWEDGVNDLFNPSIALLPLVDGATGEEVPSWIYLGKVFKYSYNTALAKDVKGPLRQRFSSESVTKVLTGLQECNATEHDVGA